MWTYRRYPGSGHVSALLANTDEKLGRFPSLGPFIGTRTSNHKLHQLFPPSPIVAYIASKIHCRHFFGRNLKPLTMALVKIENRIVKMTHTEVAALNPDARHRRYVTDPRHRLYVTEARHSRYVTDARHRRYVTDARHRRYVTDPRYRRYVTDARHRRYVTDPRYRS